MRSSVANNAFNVLNPKFCQIIRELGYKRPTDIQKKAIPKIRINPYQNYLLIAPTGSGKTEAAVFPILDMLLANEELIDGINVLYITPLRALNRDIFRRLLPLLAEKLGFSIAIRHSDTPQYLRGRQAKEPPNFLITTPETFQAILCGPKIRNHLRNVRWVIVDELHALIDNKRGCQLAVGLERLRELSGDFSIIALSATIRNANDALMFITGGRGGVIIRSGDPKKFDVLIDAIEIDIMPAPTPTGIGLKINVRELAKKIAEVISREKGKVLVFTNTRDMAELLGLLLRKYANFQYAVHHSSLSRDVRIEAERRFKEGDLKCIIATSSLELGIDIGEADLVIQVMSPRRVETAIQRIGRAGHKARKTSRGMIIAATPDDLYEVLAIKELIKRGEIEAIDLIDKCFDVLAHQIIGIAREKYLETGKWPREEEIFRIIKRSWPFRDLKYEEFSWVLNFLFERCGFIKREKKRVILRRGAIRYYFENLSTIPSTLKYDAIDVVERKKIGELDEKFVLESKPGDVFVLGGVPREILEINPEKKAVFVMTTYSEASPPRWTGELLPVSWEVARMVGKIRRMWRRFNQFKDYLNSVELISNKARMFMENIAKYAVKGDRIPDDKNILVEIDVLKNLVVIHAALGSRINKTLSLLLSYMLLDDARFPIIGSDSDAYRIKLILYKTLYITEDALITAIEDAINQLIEYAKNEETFRHLIMEAVRYSQLDEIKWYFIQVLRRFGLVKSDKYLTRSQIMKMLNAYANSPIMIEALHEYIIANLDIKGTAKVLLDIDQEKIQIWFAKGLSPLALQVPMMPQMLVKDIDLIIDKKYEEKLRRKNLRYICLRCGYNEIRKVSDGLEECPKCGSIRITIAKPSDDNIINVVWRIVNKESNLSEEDKQKFMEAEQISRFYRAYREITAMVIATTGIGYKHAIDILRRYSGNKRGLIRELRRREASYWKTRIFWED